MKRASPLKSIVDSYLLTILSAPAKARISICIAILAQLGYQIYRQEGLYTVALSDNNTGKAPCFVATLDDEVSYAPDLVTEDYDTALYLNIETEADAYSTWLINLALVISLAQVQSDLGGTLPPIILFEKPVLGDASLTGLTEDIDVWKAVLAQSSCFMDFSTHEVNKWSSYPRAEEAFTTHFTSLLHTETTSFGGNALRFLSNQSDLAHASLSNGLFNVGSEQEFVMLSGAYRSVSSAFLLIEELNVWYFTDEAWRKRRAEHIVKSDMFTSAYTSLPPYNGKGPALEHGNCTFCGNTDAIYIHYLDAHLCQDCVHMLLQRYKNPQKKHIQQVREQMYRQDISVLSAEEVEELIARDSFVTKATVDHPTDEFSVEPQCPLCQEENNVFYNEEWDMWECEHGHSFWYNPETSTYYWLEEEDLSFYYSKVVPPFTPDEDTTEHRLVGDQKDGIHLCDCCHGIHQYKGWIFYYDRASKDYRRMCSDCASHIMGVEEYENSKDTAVYHVNSFPEVVQQVAASIFGEDVE